MCKRIEDGQVHPHDVRVIKALDSFFTELLPAGYASIVFPQARLKSDDGRLQRVSQSRTLISGPIAIDDGHLHEESQCFKTSIAVQM